MESLRNNSAQDPANAASDADEAPDFLADLEADQLEDQAPPGDPLLDDLTPPQRQAVEHTEGPLLILAAAGSGKTRVITRRIAHLVRIGVPPWQVLALTFTNKAAGEMRDRVIDMLGADENGRPPRGLTITTFHSLCARLLRRYAPIANLPGLSADYSIYDSADQLALMKRIIKELDLNTTNWRPRSVLSIISNAKNEMKNAAMFEAEAADFYSRTISKIFTAYERGLQKANAVDFDDLLLLTAQILRTCDEARHEVQQRWQYLMIDEYQDTNQAQFTLASIIAENPEGTQPNICVVGDPDQSIYGWRGADIRNILEFEEHYPGAHIIALGQNFRSTAPILATADALIRHNKQRKHKDLFTTREGGEQPTVVLTRNEHHESELVVEWMRRLHQDDGESWKNMAVFYRMNALSRVMEDEFRRHGVPYVIARGTAFYEREEIKDALAYLRLLANPADDVSLARIVNKPTRGLGATTMARIVALAQLRDASVFSVLQEITTDSDLAQQNGVSSRARNAIIKFCQMLLSWTEQTNFLGQPVEGSLPELVERVINESGLLKHYQARAAKKGAGESADEDKTANLAELISSAGEFEQEFDIDSDPASDAPAEGAQVEVPPLLAMLRGYLESVSLVADADAIDPSQGAVTLMTLHAAKGLEFPCVAMIGLEDGMLPHARSRDSEAELEEERRLCFVGVTRAMEKLLMTSAKYRTIAGRRERTIPSQFINELPAEQVIISDQSEQIYDDFDTDGSPGSVSWQKRSGGSSGKGFDSYESDRPHDADELERLTVGDHVRHPQFGVGEVKGVIQAGQNTRAKIEFEQVGLKTLVLRYARLERIS